MKLRLKFITKSSLNNINGYFSDGKGRRNDSNSNITSEDIEAVVQKAVDAATTVIRAEFVKLLNDIGSRVKHIEDSLNDLATRFMSFDATGNETDNRLKALEDACSGDNGAAVAQDVRGDLQEVKLWAYDNEQYSRRQNLRIKTVTVPRDIGLLSSSSANRNYGFRILIFR